MDENEVNGYGTVMGFIGICNCGQWVLTLVGLKEWGGYLMMVGK